MVGRFVHGMCVGFGSHFVGCGCWGEVGDADARARVCVCVSCALTGAAFRS